MLVVFQPQRVDGAMVLGYQYPYDDARPPESAGKKRPALRPGVSRGVTEQNLQIIQLIAIAIASGALD